MSPVHRTAMRNIPIVIQSEGKLLLAGFREGKVCKIVLWQPQREGKAGLGGKGDRESGKRTRLCSAPCEEGQGAQWPAARTRSETGVGRKTLVSGHLAEGVRS